MESKAVLNKINGFINGSLLFDVDLKCSCCGKNIHISDVDYNDINKKSFVRCSACNYNNTIDFSSVEPCIKEFIKRNEMLGTKKYRLINYSDCRKNEDGAWEVYAMDTVAEIEIEVETEENATIETLLNILKNYRLLNDTVETWEDGDTIELFHSQIGKPLGSLEKIN